MYSLSNLLERSATAVLTAAFMTSASAAQGKDASQDSFIAADCASLVAIGPRTQKLEISHPESIAMRIGCELWNKKNADFSNDSAQWTSAGENLKEQIRQLQTRLNVYKNENVILEVLPDLKIDGKLGTKTADLLFGFVLDNNLYDFFVDTHKNNLFSMQSIYMREFRQFLRDSAPASFAQELQTILQRDIDRDSISTDPMPLLPQQDVSCDISGYERVQKCLEHHI